MKSHKTLLAWQEARRVTKGVIQISRTSWKPAVSAIFSQLQRSSLSVQLNIAEGYGYGPSPRMCNHLRIAYSSAVETQDLLELLSEEELTDEAITASLIMACDRSQKLLTGMLRRYGWQEYASGKYKNKG
jgi:four helix bundle protein